MEFDHIIYDLVQAVIKEALTECKQESQISQEWKDFREDQMNKSALLEETLLEEATSNDDLRKTKSENNSKEMKMQMKMQKKKEKEMRKQNKNHSLPFMHGLFKKLFKNKTKEQK